MYGTEENKGICLVPVLPLTGTSAYCYFQFVLNITSFILKFNISEGLADKSLDIV
jgi:hypothetical protein